MKELIYVLVGIAIPFIVGFLFSKFKQEKAQELLGKALSYVLKDEEALNKTENVVGLNLIYLGLAIIEHTDGQGVEKEFVKKVKDIIYEYETKIEL